MKKIFIGSSTQALYIAQIIKEKLTRFGADVTIWDDKSVFTPGDNLIDALQKIAHQFDGGVFVLNTDDEITVPNRNDPKYVPRDNVLIEAGMFIGLLGKQSVALCTVPGIHNASDFKGIINIICNDRNYEKMDSDLKKWLDENVKERHNMPGEHNVLMLSRRKIHKRYSIDERLHISDGLYKNISRIRLMNFASNLVINPQVGEPGHIPPKDIPLSEAIEKILSETSANVELILTQPNKYNLNDLKTKIVNLRAGSCEGSLYSALATLYENLSSDTIYAKKSKSMPISFHLRVMKTSMPFAIFNVEFLGDAQRFNHVKVDLYSAELDDEDNRRSFVIWQEDDPENYQFFVHNFANILNDSSLCEKVQLSTLKKWADIWENLKPGGDD